MKVCSACGVEKPLADFHRDRSKPDGYGYRCKPCGRAYTQRQRDSDPDRARARVRTSEKRHSEAKRERRRRFYEANAEAQREYARAYYVQNRDAVLARMNQVRGRYQEASKRWKRENPEKVREARRRWLREHPEENRLKAHRRRLLLMGHVVDEGERDFILILRHDPCSYCGQAAGTVDHIVPLAANGEPGWQNLTASCRHCNSAKHARPLLKFLLTAV